MKSAAELRAIAEAKKDAARAKLELERAAEKARLQAEDKKQMDYLLPKLISSAEHNIENAAVNGQTSVQWTPIALNGYRETKENYKRYRPILDALKDHIESFDPAFNVQWTDNTGIEYGSDGGYSDGQCVVVIKVKW